MGLPPPRFFSPFLPTSLSHATPKGAPRVECAIYGHFRFEFTVSNSTFPQLLSKGVGLGPEGSSRISRTRRKGPRSSHGAQDRCERKFFSPPPPCLCRKPHFQGPEVPQRPQPNGCQRFFRGRSNTTVKVPFLYQRVLTTHSPAYSDVPRKTTDNQKPRPHEGRSAPAPPPNTAQKGPRTGQSRAGGQTARWAAATP